jgi:hypothetical protein
MRLYRLIHVGSSRLFVTGSEYTYQNRNTQDNINEP